jgi:uncharacterized membrane protein
MLTWTAAAPAVAAAFLASTVEVVEAFTIVLAVGSVQGWRPAILGTIGGLLALVAMVALAGPALDRVPAQWLALAIGTLALLFGLRWLRKAILRYAGVLARHDESAVFAAETAALGRRAARQWLAGATAFQAVLVEGLEVVFIVVAVGAGRGLLWPAGLGAAASCALVLVLGAVLRRPLARVPENTLKFAVGVLLSAFGVCWSGEGLGIAWPAGDAAIVGGILVFLSASLAAIALARRAPRRLAA